MKSANNRISNFSSSIGSSLMFVTILLLLMCSNIIKSVSSFSPGLGGNLIDLSSYVERDVYRMADWANNCGVQQEGVQLTTYDGIDYFPITQTDLAAGSCIMYCPNDLIFTSTKSAQSYPSLPPCENQLVSAGLQDKLPLFRIFYAIIAEYEKGDQSPWYTWLNSLPRTFNNGASMTYDCFDCLPPYAAYCAMSDRTDLLNFQKAVRPLGGPSSAPFDQSILNDGEVLKWCYNVAATRSIDNMNGGERILAPMIDMFNHGSFPNVEISFDDGSGDCYATAIQDIPAGTPLTISYADPTDSTPLFGKWGFLAEDAPGTFCKLMNMLNERKEMGMPFSSLLFYKDGSIDPGVFDLVLYYVLKNQINENEAQSYLTAYRSGDDYTKQQYQEQYWPYTKVELQNHVNKLLVDIEKWNNLASGYDLNTHPRAPLIIQHNSFVRDIFVNVKANLDNM